MDFTVISIAANVGLYNDEMTSSIGPGKRVRHLPGVQVLTLTQKEEVTTCTQKHREKEKMITPS